MATFTNKNIYGNVQQGETINNFAHDTALNSELKSLLIELQTAVSSSQLSQQDKQKAITAAQTLAEVSKKPPEQQKNVISDTLGYFKKLAEDLDGIPETALKLGGAVAKIALWFGL